MDVTDFLWNMYNEQVTQGRHHETQRTAVTTVVLGLAGAVVAYLSFISRSVSRWPMSVFLIGLGIYGAVFAWAQTKRSRMHIERAVAYRMELEKLLKPEAHLRLRAQEKPGKTEEDPRVTYARSPRVYALFIGLYLLITILGILMWITPIHK